MQAVLDKSQRTEKYSSADFLVNMGIPVRIDAQHAIAHNKVMVIDGQTLITGSFNFTKAAEENNAENLLVIRSPELAAKYAANWKIHAAHSDLYAGRTEGYSQTHRTAQAADSPPAVAPTAEGYVSSTNSAVFHKPDCKSAAKISDEAISRLGKQFRTARLGFLDCFGEPVRIGAGTNVPQDAHEFRCEFLGHVSQIGLLIVEVAVVPLATHGHPAAQNYEVPGV